jgi:hypothetical protein
MYGGTLMDFNYYNDKLAGMTHIIMKGSTKTLCGIDNSITTMEKIDMPVNVCPKCLKGLGAAHALTGDKPISFL